MKRNVTKQETVETEPEASPLPPPPEPVEPHDHVVSRADGYALFGDGTTQITQHCACGAIRLHRERMSKSAVVEEDSEWTL